MTPYLRWLLRARPADYMLALSVAGASLPVVGKHLEPLGGVTAMGIWGARHAPEAVSATDEGVADARHQRRASPGPGKHATTVSVAALRGVVSAADLDVEWPAAGADAADLGGAAAAPLPLPPWQSTTGTARRRCSMCGGARICPPNPRRC